MGAAMLSDMQRKRVWEGWLSAEIRANYFADLAGRYHRRQRYATYVILLLSSGAFVTLIAGLPSAWVAPVLALLTAALSLYVLVAQDQQKAVDSAELHMRWNRLASEYARLWDEMHTADAPARLAALEATEAELSKVATAFPNNQRRLAKWQEYVEQNHRGDAVHASA